MGKRRTRLEKGETVTIKAQGLTITGTVLNGDWWDEKSGWYIEMMDKNGNYRYWKQDSDGGHLVDEDKYFKKEGNH